MSSWSWPVRLAIVHDHTMGSLFLSLVRALRSAFHTHADLVVENLALRQQLANFQRTSACPRLRKSDRAFLGRTLPSLVSLGGRAGRRQTRHRRPLAPGWPPLVLALEVTSAHAGAK